MIQVDRDALIFVLSLGAVICFVIGYFCGAKGD